MAPRGLLETNCTFKALGRALRRVREAIARGANEGQATTAAAVGRAKIFWRAAERRADEAKDESLGRPSPPSPPRRLPFLALVYFVTHYFFLRLDLQGALERHLPVECGSLTPSPASFLGVSSASYLSIDD